MPFYDDDLARSWSALYERGTRSTDPTVGTPIQFNEGVDCVFAVASMDSADEGCSLKRGEGVVLFRNTYPASEDVALEIICNSSDAKLKPLRSEGDYRLDKDLTVPAALTGIFHQSWFEWASSFLKASLPPNYLPVKFKIATSEGDSVPEEFSCEVELRCLVLSERGERDMIKKVGNQPFLRRAKWPKLRNAYVVVARRAP